MAKTKSKPATKTTKSAPMLIRRQGDLADALEIGRQNVNKMLRRQDFPYNRRGPWSPVDVQQIREWREAHLREDRSAFLRQPPPRAGIRPSIDADEIPGWTIPQPELLAALLARYAVHMRFFDRVALSLIVELDRPEYSITEVEDDAAEQACEARASMKSLPLVTDDDVRRFNQTGQLPHAKTFDEVQEINRRLAVHRAASVEAVSPRDDFDEGDQSDD